MWRGREASGALIFLLLAVFVCLASADEIAWTSLGSARWDFASSWSLKRVPISTDAVTLSCATFGINVTFFGTAVIASLTSINCRLVLLEGSSLTVTGSILIAGYGDFYEGSSLSGTSVMLGDTSEGALAHSRIILMSARISASATFVHKMSALYSVGNSTIDAIGGFQWDKTIYLSAGSPEQPDCTTNNTLFINGDVVGIDLETYLDPVTRAIGSVVISGSFYSSRNPDGIAILPQAPLVNFDGVISPVSFSSLTDTIAAIKVKIYSAAPQYCNAYASWSLVLPIIDQPRPYAHGSASTTTDFGYLGDGTLCGSDSSLTVLIGSTMCSERTGPVCGPGYTGTVGNCIPICPNGCNQRGNCTPPATQGMPYCSCNPGWDGADCSVPSCASLNNCNGIRGTCVSAQLCACNQGWTGVDCSLPVCNCDPTTQYCETSGVSPTCNCKAGFVPPDCTLPTTPVSACPSNCNGNHGTCSNLTSICTCHSNWVGQDCSVPLCLNNCNLQGTCNPSTFTCDCLTGWTSVDCSMGACVGCTNGACLSNVSPPTCVCQPGWYGVTCSNASIAAPSRRATGLSKQGRLALIVTGVVLAAAVGGFALYYLQQKIRWIKDAQGDTEYMLN